jgi:predicted HD phosphohydrolase
MRSLLRDERADATTASGADDDVIVSRVVVVGAGVGGLAAAARLAALGHAVTVCEAAEEVGGKLGLVTHTVPGVGKFRFDTGPSRRPGGRASRRCPARRLTRGCSGCRCRGCCRRRWSYGTARRRRPCQDDDVGAGALPPGGASSMTFLAVTSFTRMDESTAEQWAVIGLETRANQGRVADRILGLLEPLGDLTLGFSTDQLTHCLQTATMAERAGADEEIVVAALCHDIGKAISGPNHGRIGAEILRPYVRNEVFEMILVHQDFQGRHYCAHFGADPEARENHRGQLENYDLAVRFADEWDQAAFDPSYDTLPLEHFAPLVRAVFAKPRSSVVHDEK